MNITLGDFQWNWTRIRLPDGTETTARRLRRADTLQSYYQIGWDARLETDWLTGKLSDKEAVERGMTEEWQEDIRRNPQHRISENATLRYWASFQPGEPIIETGSIQWPLVRLQDIVAINNSGYLHEGWIEANN